MLFVEASNFIPETFPITYTFTKNLRNITKNLFCCIQEYSFSTYKPSTDKSELNQGMNFPVYNEKVQKSSRDTVDEELSM